MTGISLRCWILFAVLPFSAAAAFAQNPPVPQPDAPAIQPGPTARKPEVEQPPQPEDAQAQPLDPQAMPVDPQNDGLIEDPGYGTYYDTPGNFPFAYGGYPYGPDGYPPMGFNFGYGYRPLGYTFWPRYGDYTNFGRYFVDPYRYYTRPYMWHPYWSYQRYRQYPAW